MRRKITLLLMTLIVLLAGSLSILADTTQDPTFLFSLTAGGETSVTVNPEEVITVTFRLTRTDGDDAYTMDGMQKENYYDSSFFTLVEGSQMTISGITTNDLALRDETRAFYMNYLSLSGGESWVGDTLVGTFQLKVIAESGVSTITNENVIVSLPDGSGSYEVETQDLQVVVTTDCTVRFESNGGSEVENQVVIYGEKLTQPEGVEKEGYTLKGWYTDLDLTKEWNFHSDVVTGNMVLYAGWTQAGDEVTTSFGSWWILLLLLLLIMILGIWMGKKKRKKVHQSGTYEQ